MSDNARNVIFQVQCVSPNELTLAAHLPDLAEQPAGEALAARAAAKDHNVSADKR
jgi:hypothetical protein